MWRTKHRTFLATHRNSRGRVLRDHNAATSYPVCAHQWRFTSKHPSLSFHLPDVYAERHQLYDLEQDWIDAAGRLDQRLSITGPYKRSGSATQQAAACWVASSGSVRPVTSCSRVERCGSCAGIPPSGHSDRRSGPPRQQQAVDGCSAKGDGQWLYHVSFIDDSHSPTQGRERAFDAIHDLGLRSDRVGSGLGSLTAQ